MRPLVRLLTHAALAALALTACGQPQPGQVVGEGGGATPPEASGSHGADDGAHGDHGAAMMGSFLGADDPDLLALDAPLEVTHEDGATPKTVTQLGPAGATLMVTAAMKGYIEPCGCTLDVLLGGIDRVSGYARSQQALNPGALVIDGGSMLFEDTELAPGAIAQAMRKAGLLLKGHIAMGTVSTTPGPYDLTLGVALYRNALAEAGIPVTVANMTTKSGEALGEAYRRVEVTAPDGTTVSVGIVGVVDPAIVAEFSDVATTDPVAAATDAVAAVADADAVVLVVQGDIAFTRTLVEAVDGVDFAIVGYEPSKSDEVGLIGDARVLEPYSQGRHMGVLKLYPGTGETWENARKGSAEELARLDRRIAYIDGALDRLPPAQTSTETEFVQQKRDELGQLKQERLNFSADSVEIPASGDGFAWFSVAMDPGYPLDLALHTRKQRYTEGLEALYAELSLQVPEPAPGQPSFVGGEACVECHEDAHDVWLSTPHMIGYKTLEKKGKQFDPDCVECHVTGYGMPGGSIIGQVEGLEGIQCESCHGPGSIHVDDPTGDVAGQIALEVPASVCLSCHDPENSPRFDYDKYLPLVLDDGHEKK